MLELFDGLRDINLAAITLRMILAVLCGGLIGMERTAHRHPAGLRTHILVCLGASITMMTSQYLYLYMGYFTDMTRLGAQVIAGIGFLGAGTIVTNRQRVKGLTTAAGLWAAAIIGLAAGAGFYEGAILTTILVEVTLAILIKVEKYVIEHTAAARIFLEYTKNDALDEVVAFCNNDGRANILDLEVSRPKSPKNVTIAMFTVRLSKPLDKQQLIHSLLEIDGVILAEII